MDSAKMIKVGTRKSQLAMVQTNTILKALKEHHPELTFEVVSMDTLGDKIQDTALSKIGETSVFTKELEMALLQGEVDMVIHSLKDLPTKLPDGLVVGCVYTRDSPYDVICMHPKHEGKKLEDLPPGSVIGTSSLRRMAQIARKYPHLKFENIRGNLNTRFRKLDDEDTYAALILAEAGLTRMGWENRISEKLPTDVCMYAVCQGAIGVECREGDTKTRNLLSVIHDRDSALQCIAERSFFKQLDVGYKVPVSVFTEISNDKIRLSGGVFSIDGTASKIESVTKELNTMGEDREKIEDSSNRKEFVGIVGPPRVTHKSLLAAENAGIDLAAIMVNDARGEQILSIAKSQTDPAIEAEKQRKALLTSAK